MASRQTKAGTTEKGIKAANVPVNTSFDRAIYNKIETFRKANGLPHPQDVVRLAVAAFLNRD